MVVHRVRDRHVHRGGADGGQFGDRARAGAADDEVGGAKQVDELRANYAAAGVQAELVPFIDDTAKAFADADLVICRAGASTVTELAAIGAAAVYVPFPHAVDDHQTTNARFIVDAGGGWLVQQRDLTPDGLARLIQGADRAGLLRKAEAARTVARTDATADVVRACEELARA